MFQYKFVHYLGRNFGRKVTSLHSCIGSNARLSDKGGIAMTLVGVREAPTWTMSSW